MKKDEDKTREELLEEVIRLREKMSLMEKKSALRNDIKTESPYLVDGKYSIMDLVDLEKLERIFEKFSLATDYTIGFIDQPSQKVLISTGWRDICTKFHRAFPESEKYCKESSVYLMKGLAKLKDIKIRTCESGLVDGATPVIVRGSHIASLATGQALFDEPDAERFKEQAKRYGYNEEAYLEALRKVPVVREEQFFSVLDFLSEIAVIVAELGLNNLEIKEKNMELEEIISKYRHICSEL
ncbi:MAG: PocR ligand-binding domain-containing protein, partial [Candidatus Eremiobacterota bacterium]